MLIVIVFSVFFFPMEMDWSLCLSWTLVCLQTCKHVLFFCFFFYTHTYISTHTPRHAGTGTRTRTKDHAESWSLQTIKSWWKQVERQMRVAVVCPSVHTDLIQQPDGNNIFPQLCIGCVLRPQTKVSLCARGKPFTGSYPLIKATTIILYIHLSAQKPRSFDRESF